MQSTASTTDTVRVVYIGKKPIKPDNVAGTQLVWLGHGDVQLVPVDAWRLLARHRDVWRIAGDTEGIAAPEPVAAAPAPTPTIGFAVPDAGMLIGTEHDPAIEVGDETYLLGDILRATVEAAGLTPAQWNDLAPSDRHDFVEAHIAGLREALAIRQAEALSEAAQKEAAAAKEAAKQPKPALVAKKAPAKKVARKKAPAKKAAKAAAADQPQA